MDKDIINTSFFIHQLKEGENAAFETLYHLYFQKLFHFANSYIEDEEEAKEIVQNIYFKIWKKRAKLELDLNLHSYLFKMVKNACLDYFKHQKVRANYKDFCDIERKNINQLALLDTASTLYIENELLEKINKSVDKLPEACKRIFIKSRFQGLKHKEIAEELNISTKTVENQLTKALKFLRMELKEYTALFF
ncbi:MULTISPECIES: RNA polymerase sigma-70 factor [unclassified Flavobacterium]|uniref:RNA polymerase sigma-70 factor n=1 Tax=unclassified Flavobacterium TaxID=196869 RepID=UPI003F902F03